jgi:hypothetical protein
VTAGSLTPGTSGDLLLHFAFSDQISSVPVFTSASLYSQSNITWALRHAELLDGELMQYGVYNSTSAIDPQMTVAPSATVMSIAIAIKGAGGGGLPAGVTVNSIQHVSMWSTATAGPGYPNPSVTQIPATGNLLVAVAGAGCDLTGISYGSTAMTKRLTYVGTPASETEQVFDLLNYTPDNTKQITITPDIGSDGSCNVQGGFGPDSDYTVVFYDVSVSGTWAYDTDSTASGNATNCSFPCSLSGTSITPGTTAGIMFANITEWYNEVDGIASPWVGDTIWGGELYQDIALDQMNGWAHYENTTMSDQPTTWTFVDSFSQGYWASAAASYKAIFGTPPAEIRQPRGTQPRRKGGKPSGRDSP